jgi:hypothetical protein
LTGIIGSSITPVGALVTVSAILVALLLTRLRGGENSQLPGGLKGLLNDTFGYYLLLDIFGLAVMASYAPVATIGGFANPSLSSTVTITMASPSTATITAIRPRSGLAA